MKKLSRKARRENILRHGNRLIEIFKLPAFPATDPSLLCKSIHRIETKLHRLAEDKCNGVIEEEKAERIVKSAMNRLDAILNYKAQGIPVFFNGDPRGYALKIEDVYVRDHNIDIYKDMGGYGIICPEF